MRRQFPQCVHVSLLFLSPLVFTHSEVDKSVDRKRYSFHLLTFFYINELVSWIVENFTKFHRLPKLEGWIPSTLLQSDMIWRCIRFGGESFPQFEYNLRFKNSYRFNIWLPNVLTFEIFTKIKRIPITCAWMVSFEMNTVTTSGNKVIFTFSIIKRSRKPATW